MRNSYAEKITSTYDLTAQIPTDDGDPLVSEGTEVFSKEYTPAAADSVVVLRATLLIDFAGTTDAVVAFFDGSTYIGGGYVKRTAGRNTEIIAEATITLTAATAKTFTVRVGPSSATTIYLNKDNTGSVGLNGQETSLVEILEYAP